MPTPNKRLPNPTDVEIGARVRARRLQIGLSQEKLGELIGVTFQQVQKYEKGANRVGGSRMLQIAAALDCTVAALCGEDDTIEKIASLDRLDLDIARAAASLDGEQRRSVLSIIKALQEARSGAAATGKPKHLAA